jgi:hypothetical protein
MATERQFPFPFARHAAPCAHRTTMLEWRLTRGGGAHLGRFCRTCHAWLGWLPQSRAWLLLAPPKPEAKP